VRVFAPTFWLNHAAVFVPKRVTHPGTHLSGLAASRAPVTRLLSRRSVRFPEGLPVRPSKGPNENPALKPGAGFSQLLRPRIAHVIRGTHMS